MIIIYTGTIGSGKTVRAVREIFQTQSKNRITFTNFEVKGIKNIHRLKWNNIIEQVDEKNFKVNWGFWNKMRKKYKNFSIFLDEAQSIIHSRSAMTVKNKLMTIWVSQIRKILNDSPVNHLYIISQRINRIDIAFRELADLIIHHQRIKIGDKTVIVGYYFHSLYEYDIFAPFFKDYFLANPFFKYYDTTKIVKFGETEYI